MQHSTPTRVPAGEVEGLRVARWCGTDCPYLLEKHKWRRDRHVLRRYSVTASQKKRWGSRASCAAGSVRVSWMPTANVRSYRVSHIDKRVPLRDARKNIASTNTRIQTVKIRRIFWGKGVTLHLALTSNNPWHLQRCLALITAPTAPYSPWSVHQPSWSQQLQLPQIANPHITTSNLNAF